MLKYAHRALLWVGGVLLVGSLLVGLVAEKAPDFLYLTGIVGVLVLGFGLTIYYFTEGIAGRRTGD